MCDATVGSESQQLTSQAYCLTFYGFKIGTEEVRKSVNRTIGLANTVSTMKYEKKINRRKNICHYLSHPDAGKTTLTETFVI